MEAILLELSKQSGFPLDQLKYLFCLLLLVPVAIPFRYITNANVKHLWSIVVSFLLMNFCLGGMAFLHSLGTAFACYLMMKFLPHGIAHRVVFVWMMGYLSASHIYRMLTDWMGWSMDFTGPQMVLTIKMTTLAVNYFDGNEPEKVQEKMRPFQKAHMIRKLPNLLEFFGFVYFFPSFLAGPAVEIRDYLDFVNGTLIKGDDNARLPIMPLLKVYRNTLLVLPIVVASAAVLPVSYFNTPAYQSRNLLERVLLLPVIVGFARHKYYFAWYLAETGFVATGFAWNGRDAKGNVRWDRATNSYPLKVEFPENIRGCVENWNIVTQTWLKNYVYLRMQDVGFGAMACTVGTYTISAFWHGFYPGYYISFVTAAVITEVAKTVRRKIRPYFMKADGITPNLPAKHFYDIAGRVVAGFSMTYAGASFLLLEPVASFTLYKGLYFFPHVVTLVLYFLLPRLPTPKNQPPRGAGGD